MFADDKSIENMQQLFIEFKKYLGLQKEYTKLEVTEKLSKLLSTLLLVLLVVILGVVVLFHLSGPPRPSRRPRAWGRCRPPSAQCGNR